MSLVLGLVCACISTSVDERLQRTVIGPAYSADAIREIEINGVRLGMSETEVIQTLEAHGFRVRVPEESDWDWYYHNQDRSSWGTFRFSSAAPRTLEQFDYFTEFSEAERADVAVRRSELVRLLGRPTSWMQWVHNGLIADRFAFGPSQQAVGEMDTAWSCYVDWECAKGVDCRPIVRRVNGAVIQGSFDGVGLHLSVNEYASRSRTLLQDERFVRRDYSQAVCAVPSIH